MFIRNIHNLGNIYKGKDYNNGNGNIWTPEDGKGMLKNEHGASLERKNGYKRIVPGSDRSGNPKAVDPSEIHTHINEGRKWISPTPDGVYGHFGVATGKDALGEDIRNMSGTNARQGDFRVVVSPTHVYLYANGEVMIAVDRKLTPSKNPGDIK